MTTLRDRIANERRRLRSVRQKLTAAVKNKSGTDPVYAPFYVAAAQYMEASMARLHAQDIKLGDMLREKADGSEAKVKKALGELDERLDGNQQHLKRFLSAAAAVDKEGQPAIAHFENVTSDYMDYIVANMGHHGATTDLAGTLFKPEDWEYMAGITDADMQREAELYAQVEKVTPGDLVVPEE